MTADGQVPIDTKQASHRLGLTHRTLEQWRYLGKGPPFVRIGGAIRYLPAELDAWLNAQRVDPES